MKPLIIVAVLGVILCADATARASVVSSIGCAHAPRPSPFPSAGTVIGLGSVEGTPEFPNLRAGPQFFPGDYGIVRPVRLHLVNVTKTQQTAYLYEVPLNRALTSTFWFDGDLNPTEVPMSPTPISAISCEPFRSHRTEDRTVTGEYMTDGGSNYTAEYGLTADTPQTPPPWNCS